MAHIVRRTECPTVRSLSTELYRLRTFPVTGTVICYFLRTACHLVRNKLHRLESSIDRVFTDIRLCFCRRRSHHNCKVITFGSQVRITVGKRPACKIRTIVGFSIRLEFNICINQTGSQIDIAPILVALLNRIITGLRIF